MEKFTCIAANENMLGLRNEIALKELASATLYTFASSRGKLKFVSLNCLVSDRR